MFLKLQILFPGHVMAVCGVIYGGRYVWWQVARGLALLMTVLAGAMPGWSFDNVTGTRVGLYHTCMRAICTTTFDGKFQFRDGQSLSLMPFLVFSLICSISSKHSGLYG
jgi:hypothetical protein